MISISDIIEAKQRVLDRYDTTEYINHQLSIGRSELNIQVERMDKDIVLTELIIELAGVELKAQRATMPTDIEG